MIHAYDARLKLAHAHAYSNSMLFFYRRIRVVPGKRGLSISITHSPLQPKNPPSVIMQGGPPFKRIQHGIAFWFPSKWVMIDLCNSGRSFGVLR